MAVIGELVRKAIDVYGFITSDPEPAKAQRAVLQSLLEKARLTAFGKKYSFSGILNSADVVRAFQESVPVHDYDKMYDEWWHYLQEGHQNVTWPGGQRYFALSSGTTSTSKSIPVTDDMLDSIRRSGLQQVASLKNFQLPADFFEKQIMMLGSSVSLIQKDDHEEGEISGISAANIPGWFRGYYKPGVEIASITDWDERVHRIAQEAPMWDIGSLSGIPSWIEMMLKEVISHNRVSTIHDLWPNLQVYTSGGVAFEPYRKSFESLLARPLTYIDTYLTSEGYLATQKRPDTTSMALILDNGIFFEFVPFTDANMDDDGRVKQDAQILSLEEAEENVDYVLLISTVSGAWRYMIGDTVMITDKVRSEIRITGRTKHFLNVVGEQLSVFQMNQAMQKMQSQFNVEIKEFVVAAVRKDGEYINKWMVGSNRDVDNIQFALSLDNELCETNKNYKVARSKSLHGVEAEVIPVDHFYRWSEDYKKLGGQTKIPRVMKEDDFRDFEQYVQKLR
ncbi:GH3 auxin-responsive promoter [Rudanella paleaurantiibacter]|uniref:GH3 auxin-responsive promoter n=1 Tax=Rudanella paleaurantiibacter TaxID=2614655 RepID=A0A7J5U3S6_9BACT|nr:GH3 auxin-responsive promoter family protein [Rudanella paleaurantiibacter]KAB7732391.1 GH3 auxin-responsive promoter [Rudanella paleaurantiibacter]